MGSSMKTIALAAALAGGLYAARKYYRNWGTTKQECRMRLPGDELVGDPVVQATEAVWIDAPSSAIWPWLPQMGQYRGGLCGYQAIGNLAGLDIHNADQLRPEWQRLAVGDVVRVGPYGWLGLPDGLVLRVAEIVPERHIVLFGSVPNRPWGMVWSVHIRPHWEHGGRLLIRIRVALRKPGQVLGMELARPAISLAVRGILLGIKRRVEQEQRGHASTAKVRHDELAAQPAPNTVPATGQALGEHHTT